MIPLFKTHFSIGKSILTPEDCFELAKNEKEVCFVEDSFSSFRQINKLSEKTGKPVRFGLRISASLDGSNPSKIILFAKNGDGIREIKHLFSEAFTKTGGVLTLRKFSDNILVVVPFYDSYIHNSIHKFGVFDLNLGDSIFFIEDNNHLFDIGIKDAILSLGVKTQMVKSIYYKNKKDFKEFQFYKAVCNRSGGRQPTFSRPELEDCGSDKFCWEEFLKKNKWKY